MSCTHRQEFRVVLLHKWRFVQYFNSSTVCIKFLKISTSPKIKNSQRSHKKLQKFKPFKYNYFGPLTSSFSVERDFTSSCFSLSLHTIYYVRLHVELRNEQWLLRLLMS